MEIPLDGWCAKVRCGANFLAMIQSGRNLFPDMQFSCTWNIWTGLMHVDAAFPNKVNRKELSTLSPDKERGRNASCFYLWWFVVPYSGQQMGCVWVCFYPWWEAQRGCSVIDETHAGSAIWDVRRLSALWTVRRICCRWIPIICRVIGERSRFAGGNYVFMQKVFMIWLRQVECTFSTGSGKVIGRHKFNDGLTVRRREAGEYA